jgi:hypothetical protein
MRWLRFGLAIVCDFGLVAEHAVLGFHEMRSGLAPAASMAYLGECALPRFAFPLVLFGDPIDSYPVLGLLRFQRSHIDREPILHIGLQQSFVGFIHLLDRDHLNIRSDIVLPAEIQHLLSFGDAADGRT